MHLQSLLHRPGLIALSQIEYATSATDTGGGGGSVVFRIDVGVSFEHGAVADNTLGVGTVAIAKDVASAAQLNPVISHGFSVAEQAEMRLTGALALRHHRDFKNIARLDLPGNPELGNTGFVIGGVHYIHRRNAQAARSRLRHGRPSVAGRLDTVGDEY